MPQFSSLNIQQTSQIFFSWLKNFSKRAFVGLFTTPWIWQFGYISILSVFFWYSYNFIMQKNNPLSIEGQDSSRHVSSVIFTPNIPANPINYAQYYWITLAFIACIYILAIIFEKQYAKKLSIVLYWANWFLLLMLSVAIFPLFFKTLT